MLVLTRRKDESISGTIDADGLRQLLAKVEETGEPVELFKVTLVRPSGNMARLGIESPRVIAIRRDELPVHETKPR